nr:luminescent protein GeNL [synthetic construct]
MVSKGEEDNMASLPATHELHIFGSINGVDFDMVGQGTGNPNDGYEELNLKSTKGDLQFSPWILVPHIGYGFHQYLPYPDGMSPFQAAMVDGSGYQVHRTMQFEDGASLTVNYRYTYEGSHIKGEAQVKGTGFPADGPVMTNSLTAADWCRSKKTYPNDKTIISTFKWSYTTGNGKRYRSTARTTYTFAKPMAANYLKNQPMYVFRKTELKHSKTELNFKEWQKAFTGFEDFVGDWRQTAGYNLDQVLEQGGVSSLFQNLGVSVTPIQRIVLSGENGLKIDIHVIIPYEGLSGDQMGQIEKIFKVVYPVDDHHFKVILHYGTLVIDGVTPNMIDYFGRPYEGIAVFDGKKITVTGTLWNGNKIIDERLINPDGSLLFRVTINGVTGWRLCERILA